MPDAQPDRLMLGAIRVVTHAVPDLERALSDSDEGVRASAAAALKLIRG